MGKIIYLVRHGEIYKDGNFDTLNEEGLKFAYDLPDLLDSPIINFIASVRGKNRCHETIRNIKTESTIFLEYDKTDFCFLKPYKEALKHNTSVICYGFEEIGEIFKIFGFEINDENKNDFYNRIIKITINEIIKQKI